MVGIKESRLSMLSVSDALDLILRQVHAGSSETISLSEGLTRILADGLFVPEDSPPFDKSLMDGFAVHIDESGSANAGGPSTVELKIAETITAGNLPTAAVRTGLASRIMTGAPLPDGCNCIVPIEQTQFIETHPHTVTIPRTALVSEAHLMRRGTAAKAGTTLLRRGTRLQPQQIAALAEFGFAQINVQKPPSVAVLATGDELVAVDQPATFGRIRNSNEPMLIAQIAASDARPVSLGIARDEESQLRERIQRGLQHDFLLLTGGVSAGLLDLVPQQLRAAGVTQVFHGVHMKPGKPLWFGVLEEAGRRCLVFGLPGNPVSSLACFELFVRPALQKFCGSAVPTTQPKALLTEPISVRGNRPVYQPVAISIVGNQLAAQPVPWSGSSDLKATVDANGMALLMPDNGRYAVGDLVDVWLWGDRRLV